MAENLALALAGFSLAAIAGATWLFVDGLRARRAVWRYRHERKKTGHR